MEPSEHHSLTSPGQETLDELLFELGQRLQNGESVDLTEYTQRFPKEAEKFEKVHQAMVVLTQLNRNGHDLSAPETNVAGADGSSKIHRVLGDYRLSHEIGRGGMGVVYKAEQISLARTVALKVLPFAGMLDERRLVRFKNEARAAATLDHPHIVSVYAIGNENATHFYAMQYVEGQSVAELIEGMKELDPPQPQRNEIASPSAADHLDRPMPGAQPVADSTANEIQAAISTKGSNHDTAFLRNVARMGIQAATALEHAHSNGVLHRDIKPANLMIDSNGDLLVTDFGLARLEAEAGMTMSGDILGTLRYMSPEQALAKRGIVDARSDIYSLGATLYELATLRAVYVGDDRQMLLKQIALEEPTNPRRINKSIPRELETIILKSIRKSPDDRYGTAQDMADDLQRFLDDKPIRAKPPTPSERIFNWAQRHRSLVLFSIATIVLLTIGMSISTVLLSQANARERTALEDTDREFKRANANAETAETNYRVGRAAIDKMIASIETKLPILPNETRDSILNEGLAYYKTILAQEDGNSKQMRHDAASAALRVGDFYRWLSKAEESRKSYEYAITLFSALHRDFPADLDFVRTQILATMQIAGAHHSMDQQELAEASYLDGLELCKRGREISANDSAFVILACALHTDLAELMRDTRRRPKAAELCAVALDDLVSIEKVNAKNPSFFSTRAAVRNELAAISTQQSDKRKNAELAVDDARTAVNLSPKDWGSQQILSDTLKDLTNASKATDPSTEAFAVWEALAKELHDVSLTMLREHSWSRPCQADYVAALHIWSETRIAKEENDKALAALEQSRKMSQRLCDNYPDFPENKVLLAESTNRLSSHLIRIDRSEDAIKLLLSLRPIWLEVVKQFPGECAYVNERLRTELRLADAHRLLHGPDAAQPFRDAARGVMPDFDKAVELNPNSPRHLYARGYASCSVRDFQTAVEDFEAVLKMDPKHKYSIIYGAAALNDLNSDDPTLINLAVTRAQQAVELEPGDTRNFRLLGSAHFRAGHWQAAIDAYEKSIKNETSDAVTLLRLAIAYTHVGNPSKGRELHSAVMKQVESDSDSEPPDVRTLRLVAEELLGD